MTDGPGTALTHRERKKENTRRSLARAAAELLLTEGNEGMTVAAIAERAGVSPRTFHNYFPRREDALISFLEATVAELADKVRRAPEGETPLATLRRLITERVVHTESAGSAGTGGATEAPDTLLNLMTIGGHLSYVTGPEDRERVRHMLDDLLEALYRRGGGTLTRQATALLLISSLTAGAIAVESAQRRASGPAAAESACHLSPWVLQDGSPEATELLDAQFTLLAGGFGA
ncbi:TetR/AcrR family transcriptional regulator [Corynebacterium sp. UBA2622]|uniref:TetR/AcrR family transcriptional regulator n=1 Tax=Corynebacterium sp. UBA2622 TaxID=1946393 RepID=UPI0025C4F59C|nr:TetR/AcrR family transcriptional regulator [Corynebacterium sp. UBA2622]